MIRRSLLMACLAATPALASAQPALLADFGGTEGYGTECLTPNDDSSSAEIDLRPAFPDGLELFGARHTSVYVNTNGNITFSGSLRQYTPDSFPVADRPMIAPYWADVDIRGPSCSGSSGSGACEDPTTNGVWWYLEPGLMVVTWHDVGYFSCSDEKKMNFQLILREGRYCGAAGDFDVEFRYNECEWETGDASGGSNGFGGTPAQVGFDAGNLRDFVSIPGSRLDGISRVVCDESNVGIPGIWRFQIRRGAVECPDAGEICDTGMTGACAEGRTQCMGSSTECRPVVSSSDESCDATDNDCDGEIDEGEDICAEGQVCDRGRCIETCFEFGCEAGEVCTDEGVCMENACAAVTCGGGERCLGGTCVDVCDGVLCPGRETCRAGRCVDLCATLECEGCQVCVAGSCQLHCAATGCEDGMACEETGECVPEDCLGVRCGPGRECREGRCLNACAGVRCPLGEGCSLGACVPLDEIDPGGTDGGPGDGGRLGDAGPYDGSLGMDGGRSDGGGRIDSGFDTPPAAGGCGCRLSRSKPGGFVWLAMALALFFVTRRRADR